MKKIKKIVAVLTALAVGCSLSACGSAANSKDGDVGEKVSSSSDEITGGSDETIVLKAICGFGESDLPTQTLTKFLDLVEEKTDGAITFERYFGGTFCSIPEEFEYVSSGSVAVNMLLPDMQLESMNLWSVGFKAVGEDASMELFNEICFENEETAELLAGQAADNHIKILGGSAAGLTIHLANKEITSLDDLKSTLYGTTGNSEVYSALGLNVQMIETADMYESLSRGLINACGCSINGVSGMKLYEVAPYGLVSEVADVTPMICMNLDVFEGLSEEQQEILLSCAQEAAQWSLEQSKASAEETIQIIEEAGGTVHTMDPSDDLAFIEENDSVVRDAYGAIAEASGYGDAFDTIMNALAEARK